MKPLASIMKMTSYGIKKYGVMIMEEKRCPECGGIITADVKICPHCGFPLQPAKPVYQKLISNWKLIGVFMCVAAIICFILGVKCVKNDSYEFYEEHLQTCIDGYNDCKWEADHAMAQFRSTYQRLADSYEDMIKSDRIELWKYRIGAMALCGVGAGLLLFGVINFKKGST